MQLAAIVVSLVLTAVAVALFSRAIVEIVRFLRLGQPVPEGARTGDPGARTLTLVKEFLGHTRMNRWGIVGVVARPLGRVAMISPPRVDGQNMSQTGTNPLRFLRPAGKSAFARASTKKAW